MKDLQILQSDEAGSNQYFPARSFKVLITFALGTSIIWTRLGVDGNWGDWVSSLADKGGAEDGGIPLLIGPTPEADPGISMGEWISPGLDNNWAVLGTLRAAGVLSVWYISLGVDDVDWLLNECDRDDFGSGHSGALRLLEDIDPGDWVGPIPRGEFEFECISPGVEGEFNMLIPNPTPSFRAAEVR
jgi:hypothetical protein